MEPVVKAADLEGNCLFSPPAVFGSGGLAILKRETPNSCASIATFTVFVNVKSRVRRDKEPKTEIIVSRLFAPDSLLLVLPALRTRVPRRKFRSL